MRVESFQAGFIGMCRMMAYALPSTQSVLGRQAGVKSVQKHLGFITSVGHCVPDNLLCCQIVHHLASVKQLQRSHKPEFKKLCIRF